MHLSESYGGGGVYLDITWKCYWQLHVKTTVFCNKARINEDFFLLN